MNTKTKGCFIISLIIVCFVFLPSMYYLRKMNDAHLENLINIYNEIPLGISMVECKVILEKTYVSKYNLKLQVIENCIVVNHGSAPFDRWMLFFHIKENQVICIQITEFDPDNMPKEVPPPKSIGDCPYNCI